MMAGPRYSRGLFGDGGLVKFVALVAGFFVFVAWMLDSGAPPQTPTNQSPKPAVPEISEVSRGEIKHYGIDTDGKQGILCGLQFWACAAYWKAQDVNLVTGKGHPLIGLEYVEGTLSIWPWNDSGAALLDQVNPRFNCHGYSFAQAEYWINDPQILLDDFYAEKPAAERLPRDVVLYRENGRIAHSAILSSLAPDPRLDRVSSKGGNEPTVLILARGPGPGAAWENSAAQVSYYRHE
jgi:hypothetical protein